MWRGGWHCGAKAKPSGKVTGKKGGGGKAESGVTARKALASVGDLASVACALGVGIGDVGDAGGGKVGTWTGDENFEGVGEEDGENFRFEECECEQKEEGAFGAEVAKLEKEDEEKGKKGNEREEERGGDYVGEMGGLKEGVEERD